MYVRIKLKLSYCIVHTYIQKYHTQQNPFTYLPPNSQSINPNIEIHLVTCAVLHTFFCFYFCFCYLILRGDPLSQRLLFRGPMESLQAHTTQSQVITSNHNNQIHTHTHTVWYITTLLCLIHLSIPLTPGYKYVCAHLYVRTRHYEFNVCMYV